MAARDSYILFIDESGKSKLSDDGKDFLLSGFIIHKDLHSALSSYMLSLKEKCSIPADENMHAFDLFEAERQRERGSSGKIEHKRIPHARITMFFNRLTALVEGTSGVCLISSIDKKPYCDLVHRAAQREGVTDAAVHRYLKREDVHDLLYETLAKKMILEFGHFLEEQDAFGEVIAESRREADETVLRAFLLATHQATFSNFPRYASWAKSSFQRIHGLTFQNKKGLSFGLEVADLFGWAFFCSEYGSTFPCPSKAKKQRVKNKYEKVRAEVMDNLYLKKPEQITQAKLQTFGGARISEFTNALNDFRGPLVPSGTPPGNPGRP